MFKINPVYKKELKVSVRTVKLVSTIFLVNSLLAAIGLLVFYLTFERAYSYGGVRYNNILTIYTSIAVIEFIMLLFVVPAFTAGAISSEREMQTLDILLSTGLKPSKIIFGKLEASITSVILVILSALPILSLIFAIGGITIIDLLKFVLFVVVTAIFIGSIGIFFSSVLKKTTISTVCTYGTVIVLTVGTLAIIWAVFVLKDAKLAHEINNGISKNPDINRLVLILLINPVVTMISVMTSQYGSSIDFSNFIEYFGSGSEFISGHWFMVSVIVQIAISLVLLYIATKTLKSKK